MTLLRLVLRSLLYYWQTAGAAVLGLVVATAVIVGSLVIGDSVRGSLRDTALRRLGGVTYALTAPGYFRAQLARDLLDDLRAQSQVSRVCPVIITRGAAKRSDTGVVAADVTVVGVEAEFWELYGAVGAPRLSGRECGVNAALARDLGISPGQTLLLTAHRQGPVATDTLFARRSKQDVAASLRLTVRAVLQAEQGGDFRLDAQSATPRNLFISRYWLAQRLGKEGSANAILVASVPGRDREVSVALERALGRRCTLADHGLRLAANPRQGYLALTSDAVTLSDAQVAAARNAARSLGAAAAVTSVYLATRISRVGGGKGVAYCAVAASDPPLPLRAAPPPMGRSGPVLRPGLGGIVLNTWAAADLRAKVGDRVAVHYLLPTDDGNYPEVSCTLTVQGIVELTGAAADPGLVPDFEGITNARRIGDWDPPFPIDLNRVTARDEEYWSRYRATPKAFVNAKVAQAMWQGGPQGPQAHWVTSVRIYPGAGRTVTAAALARALLERMPPAEAGLSFRPVRELALAASRGTSDFGQLFLGLSMFLVFSGAALAATLLRLSVERRASQAGIMLACGLEPGMVTRVLLGEGLALAVLGALLGVGAGVGYGAVLIEALGSWWSGAMGTSSALWLHLEVPALIIGGIVGLVVGVIAAVWSARRMGARPVLELLAGGQTLAMLPGGNGRLGAVLLGTLAAGAAVLLGLGLAGRIAAKLAFFGSGWCLLLAGMMGIREGLARSGRGGIAASLGGLALRNAAAGRGRSLLVIGLLAVATFVIVAVAANSTEVSRLDLGQKQSGAGGFTLVATSSVPLPYDLATPTGRARLGFTPEDEQTLQGVEIVSFLASPGEDISCLNLARAAAPRILGVPRRMAIRGGFSPRTHGEPRGRDGWGLLWRPSQDGAFAAFGDADSVRWSLHSDLGAYYDVLLMGGRKARLRFVGLLPGSIFAQALLVSDESFRHLFPSVRSPGYFLIAAPPERQAQVAEVLKRNLGELGLQVRSTREVLAEFLRVRNTYLSMFLGLGGLGLLLGTVGVVIALLRGALERRRELALLLAAGFGRGRLARLLLLEHMGLILAGLLWGAVAALVATWPQLASGEARANWPAVGALLGGIVMIGAGGCLLAVVSVVRGNLIPALRHE